MKKLILIISAVLFSTLFYQKAMGLNVLLFTLLSLILLAIFNFDNLKKKTAIFTAGVYIATASMFFVNHNILSLLAYLASFFVFIGTIANGNSALFIKLFNGIFSTIAAIIMHYFERVEEEVEAVKEQNTNYIFWFKTVAVVTVILTVFISLYRHANPVFNDLIAKIDLSFINMQWLLFTVMAYVLLTNITNPVRVEPITSKEAQLSNDLLQDNSNPLNEEKLKQLSQLGSIVFVLLDVLLVMLLVTDVIYLSQNDAVSATSLSAQLHQGVNALIFSIILAIALILYFFKGNLNFYKANTMIKNTTYTWIFLNMLLTFITLYKNYTYVHLFGLTYKRIGLFVYLLLALFGLIFTFIKVKDIRNFWYLIRRNSRVALTSLILFSLINWDVVITKYNTTYVKNIDIDYLINLPNNDLLLLDNLSKLSTTKSQYNKIIVNKKDYLELLSERTWQEYTFENFTK